MLSAERIDVGRLPWPNRVSEKFSLSPICHPAYNVRLCHKKAITLGQCEWVPIHQ